MCKTETSHFDENMTTLCASLEPSPLHIWAILVKFRLKTPNLRRSFHFLCHTLVGFLVPFCLGYVHHVTTGESRGISPRCDNRINQSINCYTCRLLGTITFHHGGRSWVRIPTDTRSVSNISILLLGSCSKQHNFSPFLLLNGRAFIELKGLLFAGGMRLAQLAYDNTDVTSTCGKPEISAILQCAYAFHDDVLRLWR